MYQDRYQLISLGVTLPGVSREQVVLALVKHFNISNDKATALVSGKPRQIARGTDLRKLKDLENKFNTIGMTCLIKVIFDPECFHSAVNQNTADAVKSQNDSMSSQLQFPHYWIKPRIYSKRDRVEAELKNPSKVFSINRDSHRFGWGFLYLCFAVLAVVLINTILQPIAHMIDNTLLSRIIGVVAFLCVWLGGPIILQPKSKLDIVDRSQNQERYTLQQMSTIIFPKKRFLFVHRDKDFTIEYDYTHHECTVFDQDESPMLSAVLDNSSDEVLYTHINTLRDLIEELPFLQLLGKSKNEPRIRKSYSLYDAQSRHVASISLDHKFTRIKHRIPEHQVPELLAISLVLTGA